MISVHRYRNLLTESRFSFVVRSKVISSYMYYRSTKMRFRASRNGLDFTLSKWIVLLICLLSLMPSGSIAQTESETFESAYGLNSHESIENHNTEENELSPPHAEEAETSSEIEDLAVEEQDLGPVEKKDGEENPTSKTEDAFVARDESGTDSISVQKVFNGITEEKNGKYVRYGK